MSLVKEKIINRCNKAKELLWENSSIDTEILVHVSKEIDVYKDRKLEQCEENKDNHCVLLGISGNVEGTLKRIIEDAGDMDIYIEPDKRNGFRMVKLDNKEA